MFQTDWDRGTLGRSREPKKSAGGAIPIPTDQEEQRKPLKTPLLEVFGPTFLQKKHTAGSHDLSEEDPGWVALKNGILMAFLIIPGFGRLMHATVPSVAQVLPS